MLRSDASIGRRLCPFVLLAIATVVTAKSAILLVRSEGSPARLADPSTAVAVERNMNPTVAPTGEPSVAASDDDTHLAMPPVSSDEVAPMDASEPPHRSSHLAQFGRGNGAGAGNGLG